MIQDIDRTTSLYLNNEAQFLCFTLDETDPMDMPNKHTQTESAPHTPEEVPNKHLGAQLYAINVFKVREIIYYNGEITETAGENDGLVLGFLTVRGESMPLIDMRRWLYFNPRNPDQDLRPFSIDTKRNLVVICSFSNQYVGLKILGVKHIINKNWADITIGSEFGFDGDSKVTATTKYDDGSVIQILDVERMITDAFPDQAFGQQLKVDALGTIDSDKLVLMAEDSKSASKALETILEKLGVRYISFSNGQSLLDYLFSEDVLNQVGAVITDLEMPVISGFEVLKRIKASPESQHIPVIVNSSMSNDSNLEMAQSLHADGFISKSDPAQVQDYLRHFLS